MMEIGEAVYHGDIGGPGELFEVFVIEGADHYGVYVTGEDASGIGGGLSLSYLELLRAQGEGVAAELIHADLEGDAGTIGGLLEDHRERFAEEWPEGNAGFPQGLELDGFVEDETDLFRAELSQGEAVASCKGGGCCWPFLLLRRDHHRFSRRRLLL